MIKRIVEISSARTFLSVRYGQLVIKENGNELSQIPCEDIGVLLIDHQGTSYTHCVFTELLDRGARDCPLRREPSSGGDAPAPGEQQRAEASDSASRSRPRSRSRNDSGSRSSRPRFSIRPGSSARARETYAALMALRQRVRSGDPQNVEAQASRKFWASFLQGIEFRRDTGGAPPNNLLNYGYTVMRAAVARAPVLRRTAPLPRHPPPQPLQRLRPGRRRHGAVSGVCGVESQGNLRGRRRPRSS